jgi:hypothetical protein
MMEAVSSSKTSSDYAKTTSNLTYVYIIIVLTYVQKFVREEFEVRVTLNCTVYSDNSVSKKVSKKHEDKETWPWL